MELVNPTPVPVITKVIETGLSGHRTLLMTAKATFLLGPDEIPRLDMDAPVPVFEIDTPGTVALFPRDILPKFDHRFEVMVLGSAYVPEGHSVTAMSVSLTVGSARRDLLVTGDRFWLGEGNDVRIGPADPFARMPLDWTRAHGGSEELEIDKDSWVDVAHPLNPDGKGFDYLSQARQINEVLKCPDEYPKFSPRRPLPNIEDPAHPIAAWDDDPVPVCWAPTPITSGMIVERMRRRGELDNEPEFSLGDPETLERAHPDWVIRTPEENALVELSGMTPPELGASRMRFRLPSARLWGELAVGEKRGGFELHPRTLVLMPDENRFYITFRGAMRYPYAPKVPSAVRLHAEKGWAPALAPGPHPVGAAA